MTTTEQTAQASSAAAGTTATYNDADVMFAQMMVVHHQGAVEMADLAATRAEDPAVKELAATIKAAQEPEIAQMQAWLTTWTPGSDSTSMTDMTGMDHGGMDMPGMMSDEQMQQLTDATGAEFDRLFLELMIEHHQGALDMAESEKSDGANPDALALADRIIASQTVEIATMQDMLAGM
ncbi:DUF305 domain-containing protein [Nakamurella alba]|nr:DUF305 domain-containing protein [Nakamurella alba]